MNDLYESLSPSQSTCAVCSSSDPLVMINQIPIPGANWSIQLGDYELRCPDHIDYISCSYCQGHFDPKTATINQQLGYPSILCPQHKSATRCATCRKWRHIQGEQLTDRMCSGHDTSDIVSSMSTIEVKPQRHPTEMSCRETLLRKLGTVCYQRYLAAKQEEERQAMIKFDEELQELLELIDREEQ